MNKNKTFKDDIEAAERNALIFSWVAIITTIVVIAYSTWSML